MGGCARTRKRERRRYASETGVDSSQKREEGWEGAAADMQKLSGGLGDGDGDGDGDDIHDQARTPMIIFPSILQSIHVTSRHQELFSITI